MLVPRQDLNGRHPITAQFARGVKRKRRWLADAKTRESLEWALEAYGKPIKNVSTFRYPGRVLTAGDDDWLAVVGNPGKERKSWGRLYRILSQEGADPKISGKFYKAVAQAVLLFGADKCFLTPRLERSLDSFQHRVARSITGTQPWQQVDGSW